MSPNVDHRSLQESPQVKLPKLSLPSFSGSYTDWQSFSDIFTSLIINNSNLSNIERFHYLKSCLSGEANELLKNFSVTNANLNSAWTTLKNRYDNARVIISTHLKNLHEISAVENDILTGLRNLRDTSSSAILALKNLNRAVDTWDDWLVYLLVSKLDKISRREWETSLRDSTSYPTYEQLTTFLDTRIRTVEAIANTSKSLETKKRLQSKTLTYSHQSSIKLQCAFCKENHKIFQCETFAKLLVSDRIAFIRNNSRCINYLSQGHTPAYCKSKLSCKSCGKRHNSLLHLTSNPVYTRAVSNSRETTCENNSQKVVLNSNANSYNNSCSSHTQNVKSHINSANAVLNKTILLATARVRIEAPNGRQICVRALLDQGSEASFITESIAQILKLPRERTYTSVSGLGGTHTNIIKNIVNIYIKSCIRNVPVISARTFVLQKITSYVPKEFSFHDVAPHLKNLELADPYPSASEKIHLLIGADLYGAILLNGLLKGPPGALTAQETIFGWVLSGPFTHTHLSSQMLHVHHASESALDQTLRKFWELEEIPLTQILSKDEIECETHFLQTYSRLSDGRYVVKLPFKSESQKTLGASKEIALNSFSKLEKKLNKNAELFNQYKEFMAEYENLGHMTKLSQDVVQSFARLYLTHQPVIRAESSTTKLRVVFNASCPTSTGVTLNDTFHCGPKLQTDLPAIILRWRIHQFVCSADVTKIFRQIRVDPDDQRYQCLLWRSEPDGPIDTYKLNTVTYGTACAPCLSIRVLHQLPIDEGHNYPLAVSIIKQDTYVDDVFFGAEDRVLAKQLKHQLSQLFESGGFHLRKWISNCPKLLEDVDRANHGLAIEFPSDERSSIKVLGISWHPHDDSFRVKVATFDKTVDTKRSLLSNIAKIFDPLGWIAPVIIRTKILMQSLWLHKLKWDDPLPLDVLKEWDTFCDQLSTITKVSIPRWISYGSDILKFELHGFSDASSVVYSAVLYSRVVLVSGKIKTELLIAKTKVAPLKTVSIPRLELCGATLLTQLIKFTQQTLKIYVTDIFCWTDSTITLGWIKKQPSSWKVFVANRVSEIQTSLPTAQWQHVASKDNPADQASRGITVDELLESSLWWSGPSWLILEPEAWPKQPQTLITIDQERREPLISLLNRQEPEWDLVYRYSSWTKLLRITAYVSRFLDLARNNTVNKWFINTQDIERASNFWVSQEQIREFSEEILALISSKPLSKQSKLKTLDPFLDEKGILRVGGRLRHSSLQFSQKFPVILSKGTLSKLIIAQIHKNTLHGGTQLTLRTLHEKFWILGARNIVKGIIRQCVKCVRDKAQTMIQFMADLPAVRVSPSRPFSHVGVDYAGPFAIRVSSGRGHRSHKGYVAVFVCLTVRTVHLELVLDCSTNAFLAAYKRFVSRRGLPSDVYSDNGTNFRGASRELSNAFRTVLKNRNTITQLASDGTNWHFIPSSAPHFGGLWEAGVKSLKLHFRKIMGSTTPTVEEFSTLLCQIECCLNSRPIAPLNDDPENVDALTPGHFLVGNSLKTVPTPSLLDVSESHLSRWQFVQKLLE